MDSVETVSAVKQTGSGTGPLAVELFAGTGSATAPWCELGGRAVCFDLEYLPHHGKPHDRQERIIQDVLTLHGEQFARADFIWGSSPCQAYSWLAMPWSRSKCPLCKGTKQVFEWQLIVGVMKGKSTELGKLVPCDCKENSAKAKDLRRKWELDGPDNTLFDSISRIQREASAASGREIPYIQENVRGAVPWVGKRDMSLARWKSLTQAERIRAGEPDAIFGSFYLWGHCAQIGKRVIAGRDLADIRAGRGRFGMGVAPEAAYKGGDGSWFAVANNTNGHSQNPVHALTAGQKLNPDGTAHPQGSWFRIADSSQGDRGQKLPGFRFDGSGRSFQTASVEATEGNKGTGNYPNRGWTAGTAISLGLENYAGQKTAGHVNKRDGHGHTRHLTNQAESDAVRAAAKQGGMGRGDWFSKEARADGASARFSSKSNARKAASALIARIPEPLARYVAEMHLPLAQGAGLRAAAGKE